MFFGWMKLEQLGKTPSAVQFSTVPSHSVFQRMVYQLLKLIVLVVRSTTFMEQCRFVLSLFCFFPPNIITLSLLLTMPHPALPLSSTTTLIQSHVNVYRLKLHKSLQQVAPSYPPQQYIVSLTTAEHPKALLDGPLLCEESKVKSLPLKTNRQLEQDWFALTNPPNTVTQSWSLEQTVLMRKPVTESLRRVEWKFQEMVLRISRAKIIIFKSELSSDTVHYVIEYFPQLLLALAPVYQVSLIVNEGVTDPVPVLPHAFLQQVALVVEALPPVSQAGSIGPHILKTLCPRVNSLTFELTIFELPLIDVPATEAHYAPSMGHVVLNLALVLDFVLIFYHSLPFVLHRYALYGPTVVDYVTLEQLFSLLKIP